VPQIARRMAIVAHGSKVTLPGEKKEIHVGGDVLERLPACTSCRPAIPW
jgi:hypothetical protein